MKRIYNNECNQDDLDVYECGTQQCTPNHFFGPSVKEYYKIHYINNGKGIFEINGQTYNLSKGQGFVIYPNTLVYYKADEEEPWEYTWVGFYGTNAENILRQCGFLGTSPIFKTPDEDFIYNCLNQMLNSDTMSLGRDSYLKGYLYLIFSKHMELTLYLKDENNTYDMKETYIRKAIEFIERNYDKKITVESIADYVGIDSKYLWRLFNLILGISPVKVLLNKRVQKACELMNNPLLSIADISRSVGYADALQFSKMFKKIKGMSPSYYKKSLK